MSGPHPREARESAHSCLIAPRRSSPTRRRPVPPNDRRTPTSRGVAHRDRGSYRQRSLSGRGGAAICRPRDRFESRPSPIRREWLRPTRETRRTTSPRRTGCRCKCERRRDRRAGPGARRSQRWEHRRHLLNRPRASPRGDRGTAASAPAGRRRRPPGPGRWSPGARSRRLRFDGAVESGGHPGGAAQAAPDNVSATGRATGRRAA